jgi:two-component system, LytTR family, response regulator LytT
MNKLKIGIVEDEVIIAEHIADVLVKLGYDVAEPASSFSEAMQMIKDEKPDLLLLDIQLKGKKDGIDLAAAVNEDYAIPIIFLTADSDSLTVERAKKVNPACYLVKPFSKEDIYTAIEICINNTLNKKAEKSQAQQDNFKVKDSLFIKDGNHFSKVKFSDILYLESEHIYVKVHTATRTFLVRTSLQDYFQYFDPKYFIRIHRSYIINVDHIQTVNSEYVVINNVTIPVGKSFKDQLLDKLNIG